eukprot:CAMPEP_0174721290 /NCGR_PEP_ID=MMETSP1094-20130205/35800_1 /TAXON_ID=156173 /ORGANISM="Chrysochromulina brevifilum, Strain UTEX LB 985" /LENGTH=283 /DNA_ID=CAMNT_0015921947 /DNA_START=41 /DNA_END=890 /DNA_ORIENTATION=-
MDMDMERGHWGMLHVCKQVPGDRDFFHISIALIDQSPTLASGVGGGPPAHHQRGDWTCPVSSCANHNFAFRLECHRCGMPRPIEPCSTAPSSASTAAGSSASGGASGGGAPDAGAHGSSAPPPPPMPPPSSVSLGEPPEHLTCPITLQLFAEATLLTVDGHTYERSAIERIARSGSPLSPMTREPFTIANLAPNRAIQSQVDQWRATHPSQPPTELPPAPPQLPGGLTAPPAASSSFGPPVSAAGRGFGFGVAAAPFTFGATGGPGGFGGSQRGASSARGTGW